MNDDMMKLCKDCRWAHNEARGLKTVHFYDWICRHETSLREPQIDYVLGRTGQRQPMRCAEVRNDHQRCGPEGRYWQLGGFVEED